MIGRLRLTAPAASASFNTTLYTARFWLPPGRGHSLLAMSIVGQKPLFLLSRPRLGRAVMDIAKRHEGEPPVYMDTSGKS